MLNCINQVSQHHPLLTVDIDDTVQCPDCQKGIRVGKGGMRNYDTQHYNSAQCKKDRASKAKKKKAGSGLQKIASFFTSTPAAPSVPSTVKKPPLVISTAPISHIPPISNIPRAAIIPSDSHSSSSQHNTDVVPCPLALRLLADLKEASLHLPHTVAEAQEDDVLAQFDVKAPEVPQLDAWEVLDRKLNNALGWGATAEAIVPIVRRGEKGVEALHQYIERFVLVYGVEGALLEGKISALLKAIRLL